MAVDRQMMPSALYPQQEENGELEIIIENPESVAMMTEDGGMIIDFDPNNPMTGGLNHDSNLAEFMDDQELRHVSSELIGAYNADKDSREDWEKSYIRGLDLPFLGMVLVVFFIPCFQIRLSGFNLKPFRRFTLRPALQKLRLSVNFQ
jgi:hypothetical protein